MFCQSAKFERIAGTGVPGGVNSSQEYVSFEELIFLNEKIQPVKICLKNYLIYFNTNTVQFKN